MRDEIVQNKIKASLIKIDFLIMDEAHFMRNNDTSTYTGAEVITEVSENIVFLSATPVQNNILDLFNILRLLDSEYFFDYQFFLKMIQPNQIINKLITLLRNNYSIFEIKDYLNTIDISITNTETQLIISELLNKNSVSDIDKINYITKLTEQDYLNYIITRTKKRDVGRLIPRNANSIIVDLTEQELDYYQNVIEFVRLINPKTPKGFITIMPERMASSSMIASLQSFKDFKKYGKLFLSNLDDIDDESDEEISLVEEAKLQLDLIIDKGIKIGKTDSKYLKFKEILQGLEKEGIKQLIVFSFFKKTLEYLYEKLTENNYKVGIIHGDYTVYDRFETINRFRNQEFDILLSSEVGSEGLDMQFCNVIVNYDLPWNPMRVEQRIGRIDRIGQKFDKLHIFNLCIANSIEDKIYNRLFEKLNIFEKSIGELEPILGNLDKEINLSNLILQTDEEINQLINLKKLSMQRTELEYNDHSVEFEKLLNDEFNIQNNYKPIDKNLNQFYSTISFNIFKDFLIENNISFHNTDANSFKIKGKSCEKLFEALRSQMSNKRKESFNYFTERECLNKIFGLKEITFSTENNVNNLDSIGISIHSPILKLITKNASPNVFYTYAKHKFISNNKIAVFKYEIEQPYKSSLLKAIFLDDPSKEIPLYDFLNEIIDSESNHVSDYEDIKKIALNKIAIFIEKANKENQRLVNQKIDIKMNSISSHFDRKKTNLNKVISKINDQDIIRMKKSEFQNIEATRDEKIIELEMQRNLSVSFDLLGIIELK